LQQFSNHKAPAPVGAFLC